MTSFTARLLLDSNHPAIAEKQYAHVTAGFLGSAGATNTPQIMILFDELSKVRDPHMVKITNVIEVGPSHNLLAYTVNIASLKLSQFARNVWDNYGQLEEWQIKAGQTKGMFGNPSVDGYTQTHHITIGLNTSTLKKYMESYIGSEIQVYTFDIKPVGPHDPIATKSLII